MATLVEGPKLGHTAVQARLTLAKSDAQYRHFKVNERVHGRRSQDHWQSTNDGHSVDTRLHS